MSAETPVLESPGPLRTVPGPQWRDIPSLTHPTGLHGSSEWRNMSVGGPFQALGLGVRVNLRRP